MDAAWARLGLTLAAVPQLLSDAVKIGVQKMQPTPTGLSLEQLLDRENVPFQSPKTGGVVHRTDAATWKLVAGLIRKAAAEERVDVALLAAWIIGESGGDPLAENPNHQNDQPGQTDEERYLHADIGIAQFDGAILCGLPGMGALTWQQQRAKALDPSWAIPQMARMIAALEPWALRFDSQLRTFDPSPPYGTAPVLYCEAYNVGRGGAAARAILTRYDLVVTLANGVGLRKDADAKTIERSDELKAKARLKPGFGYGDALVARWVKFSSELSASP